METQKAKNRCIIFRGLFGGIAAGLVNLVIFFIARSADVSFLLPAPQEGMDPIDLSPVGIFLSTFIPAIGAVLILLLLNRFAGRPFRLFLFISAVFLLISYFPLTIDAGINTKLVLGSMHIVAAAGIILAEWTNFRKKQ